MGKYSYKDAQCPGGTEVIGGNPGLVLLWKAEALLDKLLYPHLGQFNSVMFQPYLENSLPFFLF